MGKKMLRTVVTPSGTGSGAALERVPVGGKTGTGDQNDGNWFVGFTPQYSCAVWQGYGVPANDSPTLFARVMKGLVHSKTAAYPADTLQEQLYCCESGGLFGGLCPQVDTGYFVAGKAPSFCKRH